MFAFIEGKIDMIQPHYVVLDVGGIGYEIFINLNTYGAIHKKEQVKLYIYYHKSDHGDALYGFMSNKEKAFFLQLIGVNKIGPSTAQVMLSTFEREELAKAIVNGDVAKLSSIKGIGNKTAQRIIVDLRDKIDIDSSSETIQELGGNLLLRSQEEVISALLSLGFNKAQINKALKQVMQTSDIGDSVEDLIREALHVLSN